MDAEIALKLGKGYPDSNILFDDTQQVVLLQNAQKVGRASMSDTRLLHALSEQFVSFKMFFVCSSHLDEYLLNFFVAVLSSYVLL